MPVYVTLEYPVGGNAEIEIAKCKRLREALTESDPYQGNQFVNVTDLAIKENLYGHTPSKAITSEEADLWASCGDVLVFWEDDLAIPQGGGYLGAWNMNFLRWLRAIAQKTGERISISYIHERGDDPYETADWVFDPSSVDVETFKLSTYIDEHWSRTAVRKEHGAVTVVANDG